MINLKPIITASAVLLLLNACSSDSTTDAAATDATDISVAAAISGSVGLNGTYKTCHSEGSGYTEEVLEIAGNTWNYAQTAHTDSACTAGAAIVGTIAATFVTVADSTITGWVDGSGSTQTAPLAADGLGGTLGETAAYTLLTLTISAGTGDFSAIPANTEALLFYVVDNTGTNNILYRDNNIDETGSSEALIVDFYTKQ